MALTLVLAFLAGQSAKKAVQVTRKENEKAKLAALIAAQKGVEADSKDISAVAPMKEKSDKDSKKPEIEMARGGNEQKYLDHSHNSEPDLNEEVAEDAHRGAIIVL